MLYSTRLMLGELDATTELQEPTPALTAAPLWDHWFRRKISLALTLTALVPLHHPRLFALRLRDVVAPPPAPPGAPARGPLVRPQVLARADAHGARAAPSPPPFPSTPR